LLSIIQAAGWPIWPLIACSILALALIFERFASLKASKVAPTNLLNEAISVSTKHLPSAETTQQLAQSSVLGEVLATGLRTRQAHPESSERRAALGHGGRGPRRRPQAGKVFERPGHHRLGRAAAGPAGHGDRHDRDFRLPAGASSGAGNPAQLAHGISIALYNTAFGLMVAIPSLIFWRYFRARVDGYLLGMELASEQFVRHLGRLKPAK
jgi:biopolymer transport protein ExbB